MNLQLRYIKNPVKKYTFLLLITSIIGVNLFSVDLGFFKLSLYRILILLSPFVFVYVSLENKKSLKDGSNFIYFQFLLFWLFYSICTLIWVKDFAGWIKAFSFLLCGTITSWFIGWSFSNKKDWFNAMKAVEILALIFGTLGLYEVITGNYMFITSDNLLYYENLSLSESTVGLRIPVSIFGNSNDFSLFILFAIWNSVGLFKVKINKPGKIISMVLVFYFMFLLFVSQSRSGFIALIFGLFVLFLISLKRFSIQKRILLGISAMILLLLAASWIIARKDMYGSLLTIDTGSGSDQIRVNLIKNGLQFLKSSFFLGVGLGNIEYYMASDPEFFTNNIVNIHNWWLEILVSSGIIVFILYIWIYLRSLWKLLNMSILNSDRDILNISACFFCFLFTFLIGAIGSSSLIPSEWLWPVMALIMSFLNLGSKPVFKIN